MGHPVFIFVYYMLADQTAEPNFLKKFERTYWNPGRLNKFKKFQDMKVSLKILQATPGTSGLAS